MIKARRDGIYFVLIGCAIFLLVGAALENAAPVTTVDFRVVYYSARCLLSQHDPYNQHDLDVTYRTQGGETSGDSPQIRRTERMYNYLPTAFPITVPFGVFPFPLAHGLWLGLTATSLIVACWMMWDVASERAPLLAGLLVGLTLANSELFLILGNPAGLAVSFCAIAIWCFHRLRFEWIGLGCLAVSLMLKPHDGGLIWLYLLLSGRDNRLRAWKTLALVIILSVPAILWLSKAAPAWPQELTSTFTAYSSHGDVNDPGPASMASHGIGMVICLQAVMSLIRDDPRFYNTITYLICGPLLGLLLVKIASYRNPKGIDWFAIAPITALTMLPVYHRLYDARLLLLTIPACAILWAEGGLRAKLGAALNVLGIVITGGIPWAIYLALLNHGKLPAISSHPMLSTVLQVAPVPSTLLLFCLFFLAVFVSRAPTDGAKTEIRVPEPLSSVEARLT